MSIHVHVCNEVLLLWKKIILRNKLKTVVSHDTTISNHNGVASLSRQWKRPIPELSYWPYPTLMSIVHTSLPTIVMMINENQRILFYWALIFHMEWIYRLSTLAFLLTIQCELDTMIKDKRKKYRGTKSHFKKESQTEISHDNVRPQ